MGVYRSKSYCGGGGGGGNMQIEAYYGPHTTATSNNDFRSQSVSYASSYNSAVDGPTLSAPGKLKKGKSSNGSSSNSWKYNDPEFQRKRRVASYKVYSVEGKVKGSFRKSFNWLKDRYTQVVYGWW